MSRIMAWLSLLMGACGMLIVSCEAKDCVSTESFSRAVQNCEVTGRGLGCTARSARAGYQLSDGVQQLTCFCVSHGTRISWPAED